MQNILIVGLFAFYLLVLAAPAEALIAVDQCGGPPSEMAQYSCPPGDYILVRPLWADGCGDWVCCPKGTNTPGQGYNCEQGVPPTRSAVSGALKKLLGRSVTVPSLTLRPSTTKTVLPEVKAPILRRGVEGEEATSSEKEGK